MLAMSLRCPICESTSTQRFARLQSYRYRRCSSCKLVYLSPLPSSRVLKALYAENYLFRVNDTAQKRFINVTTHAIRTMKQLYPDGKSLLDIGTGYGTGITVALQEGLHARGIEPSRNLYRVAYTQHGRRVEHTDLDSYISGCHPTFHFVLLIHVIEHVRHPEQFLKKVLELLRPGGILYIETPNSDSHLLKVERDDYTFLTPPDHIHLFGPRSLEILLKNCNGHILKTSTYSYPEHLIGVLRRLKRRNAYYSLSRASSKPSELMTELTPRTESLPFFDRVVAPILTPLLNLGKQGSILQVFIQKNKSLLL